MPYFMSHVTVPITVGTVALVLLLGLINMMRGGSPWTSQELMRLRVVCDSLPLWSSCSRSGSWAGELLIAGASRVDPFRGGSPFALCHFGPSRHVSAVMRVALTQQLLFLSGIPADNSHDRRARHVAAMKFGYGAGGVRISMTTSFVQRSSLAALGAVFATLVSFARR